MGVAGRVLWLVTLFGRVRIQVCPLCAALVHTTGVERHSAVHRAHADRVTHEVETRRPGSPSGRAPRSR